MIMQCPDPRRLDALITGEADREETLRLLGHARACPRCREGIELRSA